MKEDLPVAEACRVALVRPFGDCRAVAVAPIPVPDKAIVAAAAVADAVAAAADDHSYWGNRPCAAAADATAASCLVWAWGLVVAARVPLGLQEVCLGVPQVMAYSAVAADSAVSWWASRHPQHDSDCRDRTGE